MRKKKEMKDEKEKKMACAEDEGKQAEGKDDAEGVNADGQHDDADQDMKLIKKMMGEYLGDGAKDMSKEEEAEVHSLAAEAMKAHKEMGAKEDEAYQHAGNAIKLAHHMSKKKAEKNESKEDEGDMPDKKDAKAAKPDKKAAPAKDVPDDDEDGAAGEAEDEGKKEDESHEDESESKESAKVVEYKTKLLKAEGRIAALEAQTKREELSQTIDKTLKESGQPNSVTKRFREAAGEIKTKAEFESLWNIFLEGSKGVRSQVDFGVLMEKSFSKDAVAKDSGSVTLNFSNCAE